MKQFWSKLGFVFLLVENVISKPFRRCAGGRVAHIKSLARATDTSPMIGGECFATPASGFYQSYLRCEWYLIGQKPYDFSGLYWSLGLVISLYGFGLRLTTRGASLISHSMRLFAPQVFHLHLGFE